MNIIVYDTMEEFRQLNAIIEKLGGKVLARTKDMIRVQLGNNLYETHKVDLMRGYKPTRLIYFNYSKEIENKLSLAGSITKEIYKIVGTSTNSPMLMRMR